MAEDEVYSRSPMGADLRGEEVTRGVGGSPQSSLEDALRCAARNGAVALVHELLSEGAIIDRDEEGCTALHCAAGSGHVEVVQILLARGCLTDIKDKSSQTALHRAAASGHADVVRVLLNVGSAINRQDANGNAALHKAAWNGFSQTVQQLVMHSANTQLCNKTGCSALHLAAQNGHNQCARYLLFAGCPPNLKNEFGDTALHTAARYGHAGVTRILVSARCQLSLTNKNGDMALHIAAALRRRKISIILVDAGINSNTRNKQGDKPEDIAASKGYDDICQIINAKGQKKKRRNLGTGNVPGTNRTASVASSTPPEEKKKSKLALFFSRKKKDKDSGIEIVLTSNNTPDLSPMTPTRPIPERPLPSNPRLSANKEREGTTEERTDERYQPYPDCLGLVDQPKRTQPGLQARKSPGALPSSDSPLPLCGADNEDAISPVWPLPSPPAQLGSPDEQFYWDCAKMAAVSSSRNRNRGDVTPKWGEFPPGELASECHFSTRSISDALLVERFGYANVYPLTLPPGAFGSEAMERWQGWERDAWRGRGEEIEYYGGVATTAELVGGGLLYKSRSDDTLSFTSSHGANGGFGYGGGDGGGFVRGKGPQQQVWDLDVVLENHHRHRVGGEARRGGGADNRMTSGNSAGFARDGFSVGGERGAGLPRRRNQRSRQVARHRVQLEPIPRGCDSDGEDAGISRRDFLPGALAAGVEV